MAVALESPTREAARPKMEAVTNSEAKSRSLGTVHICVYNMKCVQNTPKKNNELLNKKNIYKHICLYTIFTNKYTYTLYFGIVNICAYNNMKWVLPLSLMKKGRRDLHNSKLRF